MTSLQKPDNLETVQSDKLLISGNTNPKFPPVVLIKAETVFCYFHTLQATFLQKERLSQAL